MKKSTCLIVALTLLAAAALTTCNNPIMEKWWGDSAAKKQTTTGDDAPYQEGIFYTVKFAPNGGDPAPDDQRIAANSRIAKVLPMTNGEDGFGGWYTDSAATQYQWDFTKGITAEDVTDGVMILYAKWEPALSSHKVTFISNEAKYYNYEETYYDYDENDELEKGLIPAREQYIADNGHLIDPTPGTKKGYGFAGWYKDDNTDGNGDFNDDTKRWNFTDPVTTDMILYARWDPDNLTVVTFESNGGNPSPEPQVLAGKDANKRIWEPEAITRIGYGFGGWYDNKDFAGSPWDFDTPVSGAQKTLYAKWVTNLYTVTFIADGGSPAPAAMKAPYGARIDAPSIMSKAGKGFEGWYISTDFKPEHLWNFSMGMVTENITLYAYWKDATYTITFDTDGGSSVPPQRMAYQGEVIRPPDPTRSAYVFKGWYVGKGASDAEYIFGTPVTSDNTIYAKWVKHNPLMAWIPGGTFTMGGLSGDGSTSRPAHEVTVDGFYMWLVEMNQNSIDRITWWKKRQVLGQSTKFEDGYDFNSPDPNNRGFNPSAAKGEQRPIESITWYDAVYLCNLITDYENTVTRPTISKFVEPYIITNIQLRDNPTVYDDDKDPDFIKNYTVSIVSADVELNPDATYENCGYRLPTEAEWEYAARGGNGSPGDFKWAGSNTPDEVAWFGGSGGNSGGKTQLLNQKAPNRFGIYDMSGNVCEWCWDQYSKTTYNPTNVKPIPPARTNPLGPSGTNGPDGSSYGEERVRRGGSIRHMADNCRTQVRDSWGANKTDNWNIGFRIVRTSEE